ncbi:MAG: hypothetical protein KC425_27425, partial [Anaerolineales bacterium]|nr:hypothetical protein [Anaerolineales bacterium]
MDTLYDIRDTIRDNLTTVAAVVLLAVISVGYFVLIFNTLLPGWQQNRALAAQVQAAQQSIRQAQQGNQDAPAVLQMQLETAASQLNTAADRFLSENQAAEILDNVYQYAALSGVEVANLQAVAPATTASPLVSERAFALQVNGRIPQLIGFIGRFQESTLPTVNLTDVSVTQLDAGAALSLVLRLYTSPIASGEALAAASEPIADPLLPAVTPTPAGAAALAAQLHQPWAAADWPAVITLIE